MEEVVLLSSSSPHEAVSNTQAVVSSETEATDVWSLGCIVYALICGEDFHPSVIHQEAHGCVYNHLSDAAAVSDLAELEDLVHWALVARGQLPSLADIMQRIQWIRACPY